MNEEVVRKIHDTNKNLIINGDISIGKTKNVGFPLVNNIIESKESFLILDSKEEYLTKYYDSLKEKDYNIIIINLRDFNKSEGWNCLEYPYQLYKKGETDKALDYLESIGKELFYEKNSTDPFWNNAASDLFTGIALGLFQDANPEEINFCSINHLLSANDIKTATSNELTEYFRTKEKTNPAYISASEAVFAPTETRDDKICIRFTPSGSARSRADDRFNGGSGWLSS